MLPTMKLADIKIADIKIVLFILTSFKNIGRCCGAQTYNPLIKSKLFFELYYNDEIDAAKIIKYKTKTIEVAIMLAFAQLDLLTGVLLLSAQ